MLTKQIGWVSVIKKFIPSTNSLQFRILKNKFFNHRIVTKNYYLRNSYRIGVGYASRLPTLEPRDGARKEDQHVRDIIDLNGGLGDHLHVEKLRADLGWEINFRNIHGHGISSDDSICGGDSGTKMARHDGYMDQYLYRSRCPYCLYLRIYFSGKSSTALIHTQYTE